MHDQLKQEAVSLAEEFHVWSAVAETQWLVEQGATEKELYTFAGRGGPICPKVHCITEGLDWKAKMPNKGAWTAIQDKTVVYWATVEQCLTSLSRSKPGESQKARKGLISELRVLGEQAQFFTGGEEAKEKRKLVAVSADRQSHDAHAEP